MSSYPDIADAMHANEAIPVSRYTRVAMVLHWLVAVLIIGNLALGYFATDLPEGYIRPAINLHKSFGITVLGLVVLRILWRWSHRPPAMPASYTRWERFAAHAAHSLLYVLILVLPLSGYLHDSAFKAAAQFPLRLFGIVPFPRVGWIANADPQTKDHIHALFFAVHVYAAYAILALLAVHILGALKHQIFDGERELQRMLPPRR